MSGKGRRGPSSARGRRAPRLKRSGLAALGLVAVLLGLVYSSYPLRYEAELARAGRRHGLDPLFLAALIKVESGFDPWATSSEGARGLMQLMPETARWVARESGRGSIADSSLYDPAVSVALGSWYLAYLRDRQFGGRLAPAVAAYNAGREPVQRWLADGRWDGTVAGADRIPFPETRAFVRRVAGAYRVYRLIYFWRRWRSEPYAQGAGVSSTWQPKSGSTWAGETW